MANKSNVVLDIADMIESEIKKRIKKIVDEEMQNAIAAAVENVKQRMQDEIASTAIKLSGYVDLVRDARGIVITVRNDLHG